MQELDRGHADGQPYLQPRCFSVSSSGSSSGTTDATKSSRARFPPTPSSAGASAVHDLDAVVEADELGLRADGGDPAGAIGPGGSAETPAEAQLT